MPPEKSAAELLADALSAVDHEPDPKDVDDVVGEPIGPCGPTCPPTTESWRIPASLLHVLWADVFTRMVARAWSPPGINLVGISRADFINLISTLPGSPEFLLRAQMVANYLNMPRSIPIRVLAEGGFDFVLSDQGLDFYVPPKPETVRELVRYYTFRRTGRRAIAIPFYLSGTIAPFAAASPTVPSQIRVSVNDLVALVSGVLTGDCRDRVVRCFQDGRLIDRMQQPDPKTPTDARTSEPETIMAEPGEVECLLRELRCWQISGAVYRGMMTELPRVVATVWEERIDGTDGLSTSYAQRFTQPANGGLRQIFRERLETSLPGDGTNLRMQFRSYGGTDVKISNLGMFFPKVPNLPAANPLNAVFAELLNGRAANPVFTDTMPPI